jgi:hypothetical protein
LSRTLSQRQRVWAWIACAALLLLIASRNLYYATTSLPESVEAVLRPLLVAQTFVSLVAMSVDLILVTLFALFGLPVLWFRSGWLFRRDAGGFALRPWLHATLWFLVVLNNAFYEVNFYLALACVLTLPLFVRGDLRRRRDAVVGVALLLALFAAAPDAADRLGVLLWAGVVGVLAFRLLPRLERPERLLLALLLIPPAQVAPGVLATWFELHDGHVVGEGMAYAYCESPARGRIFAMVPHCGTRWQEVEECRNGVVEVIDAVDASRLERFMIFDISYFGRIEEPVCLEDRVQVGMNRTAQRGEVLLESALEFDMDDPHRLRPHILGEEGGHRIVYDARDDVLYYFGDDVKRVHRYERRTGEMRRWENEGPASEPVISAALHPGRRSIFVLTLSSPVRELQLPDLRQVGVYPHGAGAELAVDAERNRLLVTGFFGMEVIDIASGRPLLRRRPGFLPRRPTLDPANDRAYLSIFASGKLLALDAETLDTREQIAVGIGGRYPFVSADGRWLFAGSRSAHYAWPLPQQHDPGPR